MSCPSCSAENPSGAKFCMSCGTGLATACPSCQTELPSGARFCFHCGHKLGATAPAAPKPEAPADDSAARDLARYIPKSLLGKLNDSKAGGGMVGERRVVTMLFCDVKGSTAAAENLDPEEWADIMNGAFECLIAPVYRYEGTLARLMGDAILAFFGAPIAHEDDPERAVLAALDIVAEIRPYIRRVRADWGIDIDVRVGLNTGLVVVGAVGSDLRLEYTAMGDAVNLAARMEQTAQPGSIQVAEDTWRRVDKLFEAESIGPITVKGKSEPVSAWRVTGPKQRPASERGIAGLDAPMVGRDTELGTLRDAYQGLLQGKGRVVSLIGEAGLGKSRLTAEWRKLHDAEAVRWHEGRSLSYERGEAYAPFKGIFRSIFGIAETDEAHAALGRIESGLAPLELPDPTATAAMIGSLLGLSLTGEHQHRVRYLQPPDLRAKVTAGVVEVIERISLEKPQVLVLEDLHWADSASLDLALQLQAACEGSMLLLVALFRPRHDEASWQFHVTGEQEHPHRYLSVKLAPLDDEAARSLVSHLLKIDGLPAAVRQLILDKAEGNPFFVEEVIRTLIDEGLVVPDGDTWRATREITTIQVPDTLNGVLTTRLDKLSDDHRRTAQSAAVIGREFDHQTLAAISTDPVGLNAALAELQRRGIVREVGRIPVRRYRFKHGLTRDAAYDTLLHKHRRQLHTAVADFWERAGVDRVPEIASHLIAGRQIARALPYLVDAGDLAAKVYAMPEAIRWYRQALDYLDADTNPELVKRSLEGLHNAAKMSFDVPAALEAADRLIALGDQVDDKRAKISGMNKKAFVLGLFAGDMEPASELLDNAYALANGSDDALGLLECEMYQCYFNTGAGKFDKVEKYMRDVATTGEELQIEDAQLFGMAHLSSALMSMTRYDEAYRQAKETLELAQRMGNKLWACQVMTWVLPMCHLRNGLLDEALQIARRGTEMAVEIGATNDAAMGYCTIAQIASLRGDYDTALAANKTFLEYAKASGMGYAIALAHCTLGTTYLEIGGRGLAKYAVPQHQEAMAMMDAPLGGVHTTWICAEVGMCSLAAGSTEHARPLFEMALNTPNASMNLQRPRALLGKAGVAMAEGDLAAAWSVFQEADRYVTSREMRQWKPAILELGVKIAAARGDLEAATVHAQRSEQAARALGLRPALYRALALRASLLREAGDPAADSLVAQAQVEIDAIANGMAPGEAREAFLAHAQGQLT